MFRVLLLGGLGAALPGCVYTGWREGGNWASYDRQVYVSTTYQPKTITLVDTRSGEKLASWDVPVGKKLAMQFYDGRNADDPMFPAILRYEIMPESRVGGTLSNSMPAPPREARRLDMDLRPVPEYPAEATDAGAAPAPFDGSESGSMGDWGADN